MTSIAELLQKLVLSTFFLLVSRVKAEKFDLIEYLAIFSFQENKV